MAFILRHVVRQSLALKTPLCRFHQLPRVLSEPTGIFGNHTPPCVHPTTGLVIVPSRDYAKKTKKSKEKDKGKKGKVGKVALSDEELNEIVNFDKLRQYMDQALSQLKQDYVEQLALQATRDSLENLAVETSDGKFRLIELGQVAQKNPQLIVINMATAPQYIPNVVTAIINSGKNLNPQQDSTTLFVPIPKVTRERREALAKSAKMICGSTKDKFREVQNKFIRDVSKSKDKSEDLVRNTKDSILSMTQEYNAKAEELMAKKQKELLGK